MNPLTQETGCQIVQLERIEMDASNVIPAVQFTNEITNRSIDVKWLGFRWLPYTMAA